MPADASTGMRGAAPAITRGDGFARAARIWLALFALAVAALAIALASGSSGIPFDEVLRALFGTEASPAADVVRQLRLPRALAALATGGLLATAGALMQVLLRNPLADPYVLGLSGGAAAAALAAMVAGLGASLVGASAFAGAMLSVLLVFGLANRELTRIDAPGAVEASPRLLLTGVILASGWGAAITLLLALAPEAQLRGMLFWLMGDLGGVDHYLPALVAWPLVVLAAYPAARELNVLLRGPAQAQALGVRVVPLRWKLYLLASLATALAVTTAGTIGFVGLLIPHALRLVAGNDQRVLLPASALAGGAFLLLADTAARTLFAPLQVPVGVITALFGVPAFVALLLSRRTRR